MLAVYRVIYRYAIRRLWWEDACVLVAMIGSVICVVTSWLHFESGKIIRPLSTGRPPDPSSWPTFCDLVLDIFTHLSCRDLVCCPLYLSCSSTQYFLQVGETQHSTVHLAHHVTLAYLSSSDDFYRWSVCLDVALVGDDIRGEIRVWLSLVH